MDFIQKLFKKIFKSELLSSSLGSLVILGCGILASLLMVRIVQGHYGAYSWGVFTFFINVLNMAAVVASIGMGNFVLRDVAAYFRNNELDYCYSLIKSSWLYAFINSIVLMAIVWFLGTDEVIYALFKKEELSQYTRIAALAIPGITLMRLQSEILRGFGKINLYTLTRNPIINFVFVIAAFSLKGKVEIDTLLYVYIATIYAVVFIQIVIIGMHLNLLKTLQANLFSYAEIFNKSRIFFMNSFLFQVEGSIGVFILTRVTDMDVVGYYDVVIKIATMATVVLNAINSYSAPKFAELWHRKDTKGIQKVMDNSNFIMYSLTLPVFLLIMIFPNTALSFFKVSSSEATIGLLIVTFAQTVNTIASSVGYLLSMTGNEKKFNRIIIISVVCNIALGLTLVFPLKLIGVCIALAFGIIYKNLHAHFAIRRMYGINTMLSPKKYLDVLMRRN